MSLELIPGIGQVIIIGYKGILLTNKHDRHTGMTHALQLQLSKTTT